MQVRPPAVTTGDAAWFPLYTLVLSQITVVM
jgi:hypothetical protein